MVAAPLRAAPLPHQQLGQPKLALLPRPTRMSKRLHRAGQPPSREAVPREQALRSAPPLEEQALSSAPPPLPHL
eukprot:11170133-Lingulodinium_polyedra.AAC.1